MDGAMKVVVSFINGLTGIFVAVIGLGIVGAVAIGADNMFFVGDVIDNIVMYVGMLGDNGLAGLVVLLIIMGVLNIK
tara:strand:- start:434 stop:664 length:231 start_codon:yes stop_codon:yes gene_type:complete